jgi:phosphatidylserine decarboxylase
MRRKSVTAPDGDEPAIRQVGCVFVGMVEVSSCVVGALPGQRVKKGNEIGDSQYGGSTYCLIFELGVINSFVPKPPFHDDAPPLNFNGHVVTAK